MHRFRLLQCSILLSLTATLLWAEPPYSENDTDLVRGRKIMEAADSQAISPLSMVSETTMIIVKGDPANPIVKRSITYRQKLDNSTTQTLSETIFPSRTKILTYGFSDRDDEIWIKLSSGAPKRISGSAKQGYVENSHFAYEDMESRDLDDFEFRHLDTVSITFAGVPTECYRIESKKVAGEESRYAKTQLYLRTSDYLTVRIDMWDQNGNPHKTYRVLEYMEISGNRTYTIATRFGVSMIDDPTTRTDEGSNQYTIMEMTNIRVDESADIDQSLFRKESL